MIIPHGLARRLPLFGCCCTLCLQALGLQEALLDRVLMRVMILKEDVEYSRFKTKPFQLLMLQPEEYDPSSESEKQTAAPTHRNLSAPTACSAVTGAEVEPVAFRSGSSAPGRTSLASTAPAVVAALPSAGNSASCPAAGRAPASPGAVAVAAARVSAAASALAAHMTNPQQLWHEKRGSSAGLSMGPSKLTMLAG
jgi:hypothetical protein